MKSLYTTRYRQFLALLVAARKSKGMSQQAVADKLGRPQSFVSKCESGERRVDLVEFLMMAEIIGFDPTEIVSVLSGRRDRARSTQRRAGRR